MIPVFDTLPKPVQLVIMFVLAIIGAMLVSKSIERVLDLDSMNPFVVFMIGMILLIISGKIMIK